MAQEFASDNSKKSIFARLKLTNHRGFFSFIFVTLSVIFILITFAAVQQQQTTQSKAFTNICQDVNCNFEVGTSDNLCTGDTEPKNYKRQLCCKAVEREAPRSDPTNEMGDTIKYCTNVGNRTCDSINTLFST